MSVRMLPSIGEAPGSGPGGPEHPMRLATRVAAGLVRGRSWDAPLRDEVGRYFDDLAPDWAARVTVERLAVTSDALDRGAPPGGWLGPVVELGSGTGATTARLAAAAGPVLAVDLSLEMLRRAPATDGARVRGDGAALPLAAGTVGVVALVNAFLFPAEVDRVLAAAGALLWVNTSGPTTPIHLTVDEIDAALPGHWDGVAGSCGPGTWSVHRRSP